MKKIILGILVAVFSFTVGVTIYFICSAQPVLTKPEALCPLVSTNIEPQPADTRIDSTISELLRDEIPDLDEEKSDINRNRYSNYEYAYTAKIPKGLTGYSNPAPMPQHGLGIVLSTDPKSQIWLDGSFNALFFESPDAAIDWEIEFISESGTNVQLLSREKIRLQNLPAAHAVIKYKSLATGETRIEDVIIAIRAQKHDYSEIVYTLSLRTRESRYKTDSVAFKQMVKNWRIKSLPGQ